MGRLAGGVAHDFNNLLTTVLASSEICLLELPEQHPLRHDLDEIQRAAHRGAGLTSRLLAFDRGERAVRPVSVLEVLQGARGALDALADGRVHLQVAMGDDPGCVRSSPEELTETLVTLAANARDAMPDGGTIALTVVIKTLSEALASPHLSASPGTYAVFAVTDTGVGIDESIKSRIFEPFFTTKDRARGMGLGLFGVYGLAHRAGGGIIVKDGPAGRGTTVELWLPIVDAPPEAVTPVRPASAGGTMLLVEDEPSVRFVVERVLWRAGFTVLVAGNAAEARQLVLQHRSIDLLLTDVIMPGDGGPMLAAEIVKQRPELRVLYMSGYTFDELGSHGLARPDAPLQTKPFSAEQITARVRDVLAGPPGRC